MTGGHEPLAELKPMLTNTTGHGRAGFAFAEDKLPPGGSV
jgi:hypothetical protein